VSALERLGELAKALFTTETQLRHLSDEHQALEKELQQLSVDMRDLRERVVRLEASRDADRAEMAAEIARFKTEVERAELRLTRMLPPADEQP
jgi:predicted  nucleic acid-binding Zn-ribbon protein